MRRGISQALLGRRTATLITGAFDAIHAVTPVAFAVGPKCAITNYTGAAYTATRSSDGATRTFNVEATSAEVALWAYALGACTIYATQFIDISGNSVTMTAGTASSTGTAPTIDLTQGKYPVFVYNGTSNRVAVTGLGAFTNGPNTLMTISAALRATFAISATVLAFMFSTFASGNTSRMSVGTNNTNWLARWLRTDGGSNTPSTPAAAPDQLPNILSQQVDCVAGTSQACLNGTNATAGTFTTLPGGHTEGNSAGVSIGGANTQNFFKGEINSAIAIQGKPTLTAFNAAHAAYNANPPAAMLSIDETAWGGLINMPAGITFGRIFQADEGVQTRSITVKGKWLGVATKIQVRLKDAVTGASVLSPTDLDVAPAIVVPSLYGTYTGTLTLPQYGMFYVGVSTSDDPGTVIWSNAAIGCGENVAYAGQSNGSKFCALQIAGAGHAIADPHTRRYAGGTPCGHYLTSLVAQPDENVSSAQGLNAQWGGEGSVNIANQFYAGSGIPITIICMAINSTTSSSWDPAGTHTSYDNYVLNLSRANIAPSEVGTIIYDQGESDAVAGRTGASWITNVSGFETAARTFHGRPSLKFGVVVMCSDASATDAGVQEIKVNGQMKYINDNTSGKVFWAYDRGGEPWPVSQGGDDTHHSPAQYGHFGCLGATALLKNFGFSANGAKGPQVTSITVDTALQKITAHAVHTSGGTGLKDAAGGTSGTTITGCRVLVNGVVKTITSKAFNGNDIDMFVAPGTFVPGDTIGFDYNYGRSLGLNAVYDNVNVPGDTKGRPMAPTYGTLTAVAA